MNRDDKLSKAIRWVKREFKRQKKLGDEYAKVEKLSDSWEKAKLSQIHYQKAATLEQVLTRLEQ